MQIEFPAPKINLPAVGEDKAGEADLRLGDGRIRLALYLSREVRRQLGDTDGEGVSVFALPVEALSSQSPTVLQLSAEREGVAPEFRSVQAEVPAEVAALVIALGGRVRTEVADVSRDRALETH